MSDLSAKLEIIREIEDNVVTDVNAAIDAIHVDIGEMEGRIHVLTSVPAEICEAKQTVEVLKTYLETFKRRINRSIKKCEDDKS